MNHNLSQKLQQRETKPLLDNLMSEQISLPWKSPHPLIKIALIPTETFLRRKPLSLASFFLLLLLMFISVVKDPVTFLTKASFFFLWAGSQGLCILFSFAGKFSLLGHQQFIICHSGWSLFLVSINKRVFPCLRILSSF